MKRLSLILLVLASFSLGCKFSSLLPGGGGGSAAPGSSAGSDPKADVIAASRKFIALNSFSAKMEGKGQTEIKSQVDYLAPDKYHIMYLAGTGAGMEMIMIGNQMYMKASGGRWNKMPGDPSASIPTLRDSFTEEGLKALKDVKFEGEDTVDGKPALVYSYSSATPKGDYPFDAKIWVGKDTGLPMKVHATYSNGVLKEMTVTYDTETPVKIEAPAA